MLLHHSVSVWARNTEVETYRFSWSHQKLLMKLQELNFFYKLFEDSGALSPFDIMIISSQQ